MNDEKRQTNKQKKTHWFPTAGKSCSEPVVFAEFGSKDAGCLHPRVSLDAHHSVGGDTGAGAPQRLLRPPVPPASPPMCTTTNS